MFVVSMEQVVYICDWWATQDNQRSESLMHVSIFRFHMFYLFLVFPISVLTERLVAWPRWMPKYPRFRPSCHVCSRPKILPKATWTSGWTLLWCNFVPSCGPWKMNSRCDEYSLACCLLLIVDCLLYFGWPHPIKLCANPDRILTIKSHLARFMQSLYCFHAATGPSTGRRVAYPPRRTAARRKHPPRQSDHPQGTIGGSAAATGGAARRDWTELCGTW